MWLLALLDEIVWHQGILLQVLGKLPVTGVAWLIGCERRGQLLLFLVCDSIAPTLPHSFTGIFYIIALYFVVAFITCAFTIEHVRKICAHFLGLAL